MRHSSFQGEREIVITRVEMGSRHLLLEIGLSVRASEVLRVGVSWSRAPSGVRVGWES